MAPGPVVIIIGTNALTFSSNVEAADAVEAAELPNVRVRCVAVHGDRAEHFTSRGDLAHFLRERC